MKDEDAWNDAVSVPFVMGLKNFLNQLAQRTKKEGSPGEAFASMEASDLHLGKWKKDRGMVCVHPCWLVPSLHCSKGMHSIEDKKSCISRNVLCSTQHVLIRLASM